VACFSVQGADVSFQIRGGAGATVAQDTLLAVYTTRPDTVRTLPLMLVQVRTAAHRRCHLAGLAIISFQPYA